MSTTTQTNKNTKLFKYISLITLIVGMIYSVILPFCWGNNPFDVMGTLSILCESRKIFFWIWILFDGGAMLMNFYYMYEKFGGANKLIRIIPVIALICGIGIAATLGHDVTTWNPKRIVHWVFTGLYVVFLALSVAVYALKNIKKGKSFIVMLVGVLIALGVFLAWFLILGKSGMLELVPHTLLEILLVIINFII